MIEFDSSAPISTKPAYLKLGIAPAEFADFPRQGAHSFDYALASTSQPRFDDQVSGAGVDWFEAMLSDPSAELMNVELDDGGGSVEPVANETGDGSSGEGEEIVVTGKRPRELGYTGGGEGDTGGTGGDPGGVGGGGGTGPSVAGEHDEDCGTDDGAAVQVAKKVMGTLPPGVSGAPNALQSPSGNDWREVEFSAAIVRNPDGTFGAFNDSIYTLDLSDRSSMPNPAGYSLAGTWHNHSYKDDAQDRAVDRYPSSGDWSGLASVAAPGTNPSIWLTGPDGVTREFKLSERNQVQNLTRDQMINGVGLDGRERTQSCGG